MTNNNTEALRACFECTDWNIFSKSMIIDMAAEVITDYIKFCEDMIVSGKEIKTFPNSKSWVNKDIRKLL